MRQLHRFCVAATCAFLLDAPTAYAGGLEYTGQGAQSLARGGAVTARAEDPMVLAHNPAGLVELRGSQFLFNLNIALMDACVDPSGFYGWGTYGGGVPSRLRDPKTGAPTIIPLGQANDAGNAPRETEYYTDPYDTVCLEQTIVPLPQIAWTRRISEKVGIGFGLIFPPLQPSGAWGGKNGVIRGDDGDLRPAATRYMMLSSFNLGVFPTLGVAYRFSDMFRLGVALEWGIISANQFVMAAATGGTTPANDIIAHVKVQDYFIPAFTVSAHVVPTDAIDIVAAFRFQDDLKGTGDLDLTTGIFDPMGVHRTKGSIEITELRQAMPWKLRGGVRYADRLTPRPTGTGSDEANPARAVVIHDPLQDERWDVELDAEWQMNSRNDKQFIDYRPGQYLEFENTMGTVSTIQYPLPEKPFTEVQKQWKDQVSVRLGGTLNVVPGLFGVSGGAHYETRGVDPSYMQIDFWPLQRVGLHTGVIVRLFRSVDLVLSYGHIFQETLIVAAPAHRPREEIDTDLGFADAKEIDKRAGTMITRSDVVPVLDEKSQGASDGTAKLNQIISQKAGGEPPWIINAGRYRSNFDIFSAGVNLHF